MCIQFCSCSSDKTRGSTQTWVRFYVCNCFLAHVSSVSPTIHAAAHLLQGFDLATSYRCCCCKAFLTWRSSIIILLHLYLQLVVFYSFFNKIQNHFINPLWEIWLPHLEAARAVVSSLTCVGGVLVLSYCGVMDCLLIFRPRQMKMFFF